MLDKPINTIRVYATRRDLGIWIGNQRFLSDADIAKLAGARRGPRPKPQPQAAQP